MYNPQLHFHFVGIGGSGMSGIAEILLNLGFQVSGSDLSRSPVSSRLEQLGATVHIGHAAENLADSASLLVYSSAVRDDNAEVVEARRRGLPVVPRAEVLAELMRLKFGVGVAGSHGKTTTTSMVAAVMDAGKLDPTVIIGGRVKSIGSGGRLGKGAYLVAESDESDRSFLRLKPTVAVVTNIDNEHMNAYSSFDDLKDSFRRYVDSVPFYGLAVLCIDCPHVREIAEDIKGRRVTYGVSADAQLQAHSISHDKFTTSCTVMRDGVELFKLCLPLPGEHLLMNSLAAIAVGLEFGVEPQVIKAALESFSGVERRFEVVGAAEDLTVVNDYGHHPTEIAATIEAVQKGWSEIDGTIHVLFQPHRFSRTRDCFDEFRTAFSGCDRLYIVDIYPAGEAPLPGITAERLAKDIEHPQVTYLGDLENATAALQQEVRAGDIVLCLGAGSIGAYATELADTLLNKSGTVAPLKKVACGGQ